MNAGRVARVKWLIAHKCMWEGWLDRNDPRARMIVEAMRKDGVVAPTTYWPDVQLTNLIQDARRILRAKEAQGCKSATTTTRPC
jgi:hypothetical protein